MPHVPPGDNTGVHSSQFEGVPPGYVYILTPLSDTQSSNWDAYANDSKCNEDVIPEFLTDGGTSTG